MCFYVFYVFLKKSAQPTVETSQSARMDVAQRNESVGVNHVVQSLVASAADMTEQRRESSSLDSIQSSDLE